MKTGTSAIQVFIKNNQSFLQENNFYYPNTNIEAMNFLAFSLLEEIPPFIHHKLDVSAPKLYKNLIEEIENSKEDNIILSTEAFYLISTDLFLGKEAPLSLYKILNRKNFDFKIISFIRRQDDYLETQYNQHIKTHNFWNLFSGDILEFYNQKRDLFDFDKILNYWSDIFGENNMLVKVYDKGMDSVSEFLSVLNIKAEYENDVKTYQNPKLSYKALEFMRMANQLGVIKKTANQNYLLVELIEKALKNSTFNYNLLDEESRSRIMLEFKQGNENLSNRFLNGSKNWYLKENKISNNEISAPQKLTLEESIEITTKIWNYFQNNKK